MTETKTIYESIWNADGWHCAEEKWTDEVKRLKIATDDANYSMVLYWHEPNIGWIVVLSEDMTNDSGERIYGVLEKSDTFETYQDALDYVVELTEKYP